MEPTRPPGAEAPIAPQVSNESFNTAAPSAEQFTATPERVMPSGESVSQGAPSVGATLPAPIDPAVPQSSGPAAGLGTQSTSAGPAVADDVDVIEKQWVDKAKAIVNEHRHDPYTQEKEVGKLQADYLKKRYGKELKPSE